jgi:hypothetical protein
MLEPRKGLPAAIEALQTEFFGSIVVALVIDPSVDGEEDPLLSEARDAMHDVVRETLRALQATEARTCDVTLRRSGSQLMLNVLSDIGDGEFDPTHINAHANRCEQLGGYLSVDRLAGNVAVSAELSLATAGTAAEGEHEAPPADASVLAAVAGQAPAGVEPVDAVAEDRVTDPAESAPSGDTSAGSQHAA